MGSSCMWLPRSRATSSTAPSWQVSHKLSGCALSEQSSDRRRLIRPAQWPFCGHCCDTMPCLASCSREVAACSTLLHVPGWQASTCPQHAQQLQAKSHCSCPLCRLVSPAAQTLSACSQCGSPAQAASAAQIHASQQFLGADWAGHSRHAFCFCRWQCGSSRRHCHLPWQDSKASAAVRPLHPRPQCLPHLPGQARALTQWIIFAA